MFGNLGANYLVEAPVSLTEQSGSDKVQTPFKRLMRRTRLLTHPSGSSVKQGGRGNRERKRKAQPQRFPYERSPRRFFGFFLIAQKETRRRSGETSVSFFRGCSACGRATFQRRNVTASSQSPLCSGHPGLGIPHAAPLLLLSNHEPLRWVHGWGPIASLRARTQESCAVSSSIPSGAVPSGRVSNRYRYRSAQ